MQPSVPEHTRIDITYGTGNQVVNSNETFDSENDYYSANEDRMAVDGSGETTASTVGRSSNFLFH